MPIRVEDHGFVHTTLNIPSHIKLGGYLDVIILGIRDWN